VTAHWERWLKPAGPPDLSGLKVAVGTGAPPVLMQAEKLVSTWIKPFENGGPAE